MVSKPVNNKETSITWLALFTTTGTLVCCALPITLVALGLGATMASLVSHVPLLVTLSEHKAWVFAISGSLLALSAWMIYRPGQTCPTDPKLGALCNKTQKWNRRIVWLSASLWGIGFFAAFLALPLQIWFDT
jgi:mercuric ion transport protein